MTDFYKNVTGFRDFRELMEDRHYTDVPDDWAVVLTDIRGSTRAIAENRYKDVNLVGAASIASALNSLRDRDVPYVFGGDGATLLVHNSQLEDVKVGLRATLRLAKEVFDLEMRIGFVSVEELRRRGFTIEVARFTVSASTSFAMIRGGGIAEAERLVKSGDRLEGTERLEYERSNQNLKANSFEGLSCRWNPIQSKRGEMLSILIVAVGDRTTETYRRVLAHLDRLLPNDSEPVRSEKFERTATLRGGFVFLQSLLKEMRIKTNGVSLPVKIQRVAEVIFELVVMRLMVLTGLSIDGVSASEYRRELIACSDSKKYDDTLRMIRDCSASERKQLEEFLESEFRSGTIAYGIHASNEAMMTCLVHHLKDHVHFIDGGGGGYALAAKDLKERLRRLNILTVQT